MLGKKIGTQVKCRIDMHPISEQYLRHEKLKGAPFEMVNAGLHWSLKMSKQIEPFALMFGW